MTEHNRKVAVLLVSILQCNLTVAQLRRHIEEGKAQVKRLGPGRVSPKQLAAIAAGVEALERIKREKVKYDRHTNS